MDTEIASTRNEITIHFICIDTKTQGKQKKISAKTDTGIAHVIATAMSHAEVVLGRIYSTQTTVLYCSL